MAGKILMSTLSTNPMISHSDKTNLTTTTTTSTKTTLNDSNAITDTLVIDYITDLPAAFGFTAWSDKSSTPSNHTLLSINNIDNNNNNNDFISSTSSFPFPFPFPFPSTPPSPFLPNNQTGTITAWLCNANESALWQLKEPVCTTRYRSLVVFVIVAAILTVITLWTILGNVLVLVALYRYKTLRTMSNCLIGNLAISDLLLAVTVLPVSTINDLLGYWVFGDVACALWLCMDVLYCTASVWGLCTVAFDRYMATAYPVWYHDKRSVKKAVGCVVFVWIFSIVISFAPFIGWQGMIANFFTFNREIQRYECILFMSSSYVIYSSTGSFLIPTCLMTFMYIRIFRVLHRQSRNMKKKIEARKSVRRRAVMNGYPTIRVPEGDGETVDAVVRDFTTTTLVSITNIDSCAFTDDRERENSIAEREHLLHVPTLSLHSANGVSVGHRDMDCLNDEDATASPSPDNETRTTLQNGDSVSRDQRAGSYDSTHSTDSQFMNTSSFISNQLTVPDIARPRTPQRRSHSVCTMSGPASNASSSINGLNVSDFERRNSHEGTTITTRPNGALHRDATDDDDRDASPQIVLLKPVSQRSKSANVLTDAGSEEESPLGHTPQQQQPRRSLPCDLTKLSRNNKMTLSMKRRFEMREQRATKRMLLIMACFIVCWMPFVGMYITRSLCHACDMNTHLVAAIIWLGYANSSLNPVLYSLFNDDFKAAFKRLLGMKSPPPRRRR